MSDTRRVTETMLKAGQKECPVDATLSHATLRAIYQAMSAAASPDDELARLEWVLEELENACDHGSFTTGEGLAIDTARILDIIKEAKK